MHICYLCEGDCDCDGEDLHHDNTPDDCVGCGCEDDALENEWDDDPEYYDDDDWEDDDDDDY